MEELDYRKGAVPLYLQIKNILKKKILEKEYPPDSMLPSELELQNRYSVSRITARQAILELEQEGLVHRARGKGTVVIYQKKIDEFLTTIKSFTNEMKERNKIPGTKAAQISMVPADNRLAELFGCRAGDSLYRLYRIRTADGEPIVLFLSYFSKSRKLPLDSEAYMGSLYELFDRLGIHSPSLVKERFEAELADRELAEALDIKKGDAVLKRIRTSYDALGEILEYTLSYYRADRYSYSVEIRNK